MNKGSRQKRRKDSQKTNEGPSERKKCLRQMKNDHRFAEPLPYEPSSLDWDSDHRVNRQNCYCYCGGPGCWMEMMQCHECRQWFHYGCIKCPTDSLVSGDLMYIFFCSSCFQEEYYVRLKVSWGDLVYLALLNLEKQKRNEKYFDLETDIHSWISGHWHRLKPGQLNKVALTDWMKELEKALKSDEIRFVRREGRSRRMRWGLVQSLPLSPSYIDFSELSSPPVPLHRATALQNQLTKQSLAATAKEASNRVSITKKSSTRICKNNAVCKEPVARPPKLKQWKSSQKGMNGSLLHSSAFALETPSFQTVSTNNIQTGGILDRLIPAPLNYDGINHPFKTDNERLIEMELVQRRATALSPCCLKSVDSSGATIALDRRMDPDPRHQSASNLLNFSGVDIANHPKSPEKSGQRKSLPTTLNEDEDIPLAQMRARLQADVAAAAEDSGGQWGRPLAKRISSNSVQYLMEWNEQALESLNSRNSI